jgi:hypothetical protein
VNRDIHPFFFAGDADAGLLASSKPGAGEMGGGSAASPGSPPVAKFTHPVKYLALDQSASNIGWAAMAAAQGTRPFCNTLKPPKITAPDGTDMIEIALLAIENFIEEQLRHDVTHVFIESCYFDKDKDNPATFAKLTTIRDFIRYLCKRRSTPTTIRCEEVEPRTWRKHFLGYADSGGFLPVSSLKDAAMVRCREIGWSVVDEHQAEACGILNYALCRDFPDFAPHWDPKAALLRRRT